MGTEQTFFSENGVTVTQARFVVPGQTFAMSGVTSVAKVQTNPGKAQGKKICLYGLVLGIFIIPLVLIPIGIIMMLTAKPLYSVVLSSASGETSAYSSNDHEFIDSVVAALTDAIVARG
ncbi:MAG: DUF6232 family protein [Gammaproteobacteria bacterium]